MRMFRQNRKAPAAIASVILAAMYGYFYLYEGYLSNAIFMTALAGAIISALAFLTRRVLFPTVLFASFASIVAVTAYVKFEALTFALHAWDFFYYAQSWSIVGEWWQGRPVAIAILVAGILSLTVGSWIAWRIERPLILRRWASVSFALMIGVASLSLWVRGERMHMQFNFPDWHVTSFFVSLQETVEALRRGSLIEAAKSSGEKPFDPNWTCTPQGKPPHIIMIHQESVGPPQFFPQVQYDPVILPIFNSFDGKLHKMNVETFGGASWLTESAVLLGLSSRFFGSMKDFIQFFMAGKLQESLPQVLEKCGYRNVMFYPYIFGTFGNKRFFETIGLREVFDRRAQGAQEDYARDRFYYDSMMKEFSRHLGKSQKPMFAFLQTMVAHWPYDVAMEPGVEVPDGGDKNHPEMGEYLRRLAMVNIDLDYLKKELWARFPDEQFLLVQYGDHHAVPFGYLWGYDKFTDVQDMVLPKGYPLYTTYYSVDGVNYTPPRLPALDSVDTAFVGAIFLDAARLPLPESWRERLRLMQLCEGKAFECKQRDGMLKFHRRLIESGLMTEK